MSDEPEPTLFDKIIRGEIPSHGVYDDEHVYAFLDIMPQSRGHTLVVPKESKAFLHELSPESGAAIGRALPRLCRAVMEATGASAYNILQNNGKAAGQAVFHVHFHIIPCLDEGRLAFEWNPGSLDDNDAKTLVSSIRAALARA